MAFTIANFAPLGNTSRRGKAPAEWTYKTTDSLATCDTAAYFNGVSTILSIGDRIHISVVDDVDTTTAITDFGTATVDTNASGVVDTNNVIGTGKIYLNVTMADVSTAASVWVVAPVACTYTKMWSVINGTIATAPAVITTEIAGTLVTNGGMSITDTSSAAGDVDIATPTALNVLTAGQALEIITSGASTNTIIGTFTVELTPSGQDSD